MSEEKVSILLVDDHVENLVALEALLTDLGQNLVRVESGLDALRLLLHQEFALIILDVDMPIMNGFETAALIREREKSRFTPIIFLTAINKTEQHALNRSTTEPLDDAVYGACCGGFSRLLSAINERAAHHRVGHVALLFQTVVQRLARKDVAWNRGQVLGSQVS